MSEMLIFKPHYPYTFDVDVDPDTGEVQRIQLRITRLDVEQGRAFVQAWERQMSPASGRAFFRRPDGEEQATVERGTRTVFLIGDDEIRRRRLEDMTADQRTAHQQLLAQEEAEEAAFLGDTVRQYVRVAPGQRVVMEPAEGGDLFEVHTGDDLVRAFGGHRRLMRQLVLAVHAENTLGPQEKKLWRSLFASTPSSSAPGPAALGPTPAATARPVETVGSAPIVGVTGSPDVIRSGLTQTASC